MKNLLHCLLLCAFLSLSLSGLSSGAFAADQANNRQLLPITIGGPTAGYWDAYVADELGLYQKYGLKPKFYWFTSGAPLLAGLKSGSIDVVITGLAIVFALGQHIPLKLVFWSLDHSQGGGLIADPSKSGIHSYADIAKAKKIGVQRGTCSQVSLALIAKKVGIDYDKLNTVNLAPPLYANAFISGSIDAATAWAPYTLTLPKGYKVVSWDSAYGGVCPSLTGIRPAFLKEHPDVAFKLLKINQEARARVRENPQLAIHALQKYLHLSESVAKKFYEVHCCKHLPSIKEQLEPNNRYSMVAKQGGLAKQLYVAGQMLYKTGTIPAPLSWSTVDEAVDPFYLKGFAVWDKKHYGAK